MFLDWFRWSAELKLVYELSSATVEKDEYG